VPNTSALKIESANIVTERGYIAVDDRMETNAKGVYAIGDITGPPHLASIAAANGVRAALSIHRSLLPPEREL
jgi:dihydrolipoamide dehydrogenase